MVGIHLDLSEDDLHHDTNCALPFRREKCTV